MAIRPTEIVIPVSEPSGPSDRGTPFSLAQCSRAWVSWEAGDVGPRSGRICLTVHSCPCVAADMMAYLTAACWGSETGCGSRVSRGGRVREPERPPGIRGRARDVRGGEACGKTEAGVTEQLRTAVYYNTTPNWPRTPWLHVWSWSPDILGGARGRQASRCPADRCLVPSIQTVRCCKGRGGVVYLTVAFFLFGG